MNSSQAKPPGASSASFSDEEMVAAAKEHPKRFEALYNKYYEPLLRFVYQRVATKDEALDITHQVFLKAMLKLPDFVWQGHPFSSWLYRIALNELNQMFRQEQTKRAVYANAESMEAIKAETNGSDDLRSDAMLLCITRLSEDEYELIELRFFEARPFKEIGEILNISENNAKVKLYRIIDKLKAMMQSK